MRNSIGIGPGTSGIRGSAKLSDQRRGRGIRTQAQYGVGPGVGRSGDGHVDEPRVGRASHPHHVSIATCRVRGRIEGAGMGRATWAGPGSAHIRSTSQGTEERHGSVPGTDRQGPIGPGIHRCPGRQHRDVDRRGGDVLDRTSAIEGLHQHVDRRTGQVTGPAQRGHGGVGTVHRKGRTRQQGRGLGDHVQHGTCIRVREHQVHAEGFPITDLDRSWTGDDPCGVIGQAAVGGGGTRAVQHREHQVTHHGADQVAHGIVLLHQHHHHIVAGDRRCEGDLTVDRIEHDPRHRVATGVPCRVGARGGQGRGIACIDQGIDQGVAVRLGDPEVVVHLLVHAHVWQGLVRERRGVVAGCGGRGEGGLHVHGRIGHEVHRGVPAADRPADRPVITGRQVHRGLEHVMLDPGKGTPVAGAVGKFRRTQL